MKVLITAPSLDKTENVSGISTMIASIIANAGCEFVHFTAGRKDGGKFDINWILAQLRLPFAFRAAMSASRADVVHINTAFEPRAIIRDLVLAMSCGKRPVVLHIHGGRFVMQDFPNSALRAMATRLIRSASRVVVLSDIERERILRLCPESDVVVLPNAVATAEFAVVDREWKRKNILYLGRLDKEKGLDDIVEACRMLRAQGFKFSFTCCGAGPDETSFTAAMTEVLGDDFRFAGVISGDEKLRTLNEADILLMPSRFEGLPLALLEAMAAGCVPVVSNRGSIPTVVEDGRNGFLIEPGNLTQIVGRIKVLLSEGETGWEEYRRNARDTVRERFDIAQYVDKLTTVYRELASK